MPAMVMPPHAEPPVANQRPQKPPAATWRRRRSGRSPSGRSRQLFSAPTRAARRAPESARPRETACRGKAEAQERQRLCVRRSRPTWSRVPNPPPPGSFIAKSPFSPPLRAARPSQPVLRRPRHFPSGSPAVFPSRNAPI